MMKINHAVFKGFGFMVVAVMITVGLPWLSHPLMPHAHAQNTLPGLPPLDDQAVIKTTGVNEMAQLFKEIGIDTQIIPAANGGVPNVLAVTPNGGRFYLQFVACEEQLERCGGVLFRAAISNTGVTYDDLNAYNIQALVIKAVNIANSNLIFFVRHNVLAGGVQRRYLKVSTAFFLRDMDTFLKSQSEATSVSFELDQTNPTKNKIEPITSSNVQNNDVFKNTVDASLLDSAIYNTRDVRFMTPEAKLILPSFIE